MYYLETNSIRILSNRLIKQNYRDNCYTSILSICELLSGIIDERTFNQRKGIIRKVYLSRILADHDLPETKMYRAYKVKLEDNINDKIILLGALCIASRSFLEFLLEIQKSNLLEYWEFLKIYDKAGDVKFKESFKMRQTIFDYSDSKLISDFKNRWYNLNDNQDLRERILNEIIIYFAESLLKPDSVISVKDKSLKDLINAYDHSLDLYFICIGYFTGTKIVFKNVPSRNDYFDLCHLMYLNNTSSIIVSNDSMILELMNKLHPSNILSVKDFETIIEK